MLNGFEAVYRLSLISSQESVDTDVVLKNLSKGKLMKKISFSSDGFTNKKGRELLTRFSLTLVYKYIKYLSKIQSFEFFKHIFEETTKTMLTIF